MSAEHSDYFTNFLKDQFSFSKITSNHDNQLHFLYPNEFSAICHNFWFLILNGRLCKE